MSKQHSVISFSGSERWTTCTPSARLEELEPDTQTDAAREGTFFHHLCETMLRKHFKIINIFQYRLIFDEIKRDEEFYNEEMQNYADEYVNYVIEKYNELRMETPDTAVFIEEGLDLAPWYYEDLDVPEEKREMIEGTGDAVMIADGLMDVVDAKYGKGVFVEAEDNSQMKMYAWGAYQKYGLAYDVDRIRMTIYQPRLNNIAEYEITISELTDWAENFLKGKMTKALAGEGDQVVGEHCSFCKVGGICRARATQSLELLKYEMLDPYLLLPEEVPGIIRLIDVLMDWGKDFKDYTFKKMLEGRKVDGFKIVEGRSNRKYKDEGEIVGKAQELGLTEEQLYNRKIIGIGALEKLLGKAKMNNFMAPLLEKPRGKPTMVPSFDKRPEYDPNAGLFDDGVDVTAPEFTGE